MQEAMRPLFRVMHDRLGNFGAQPALFPDVEIPIIRNDDDGNRKLTLALRAFPPAQRGVVTYIRNLKSRFWAGWLGKPQFRCLVSFTSFAEYHPTEKDQRGRKKVA